MSSTRLSKAYRQMAHRSSSSSPLLILWKRNDSNVNLVIEYSDFICLWSSIANKSGKYVLYAAPRQMSNFVFYKILVVMEENRECLFRIKKRDRKPRLSLLDFSFFFSCLTFCLDDTLITKLENPICSAWRLFNTTVSPFEPRNYRKLPFPL